MFLHFLVSSWLGRVPRPVALFMALAAGPNFWAEPLKSFVQDFLNIFYSFLWYLDLVVCLLSDPIFFLLVSVHVVSNILLIIIFPGGALLVLRSRFLEHFFFGREYWPVEHLLFYASFEAYFFMMFTICILSVY